MDTRFLVDDLKLVPKDPERPKTPDLAPAPTPAPAAPLAPADAAAPENQPLPAGTGKVSVTVDQITRPGSIISGKVTFSDAQTAEWYLDQAGRLAVIPQQQGYKPSEPDVQDFQIALQQEVAKLGY
jgi:hypothetical protein